MSESAVGEIVEGLWRFEALLPEWTEEESGEDGWEQNVAWWVIETPGALVFGDVMLRTSAGQLRVCPESWTQPAGGPARLRRLLAGLTNLPVAHVLVSHGPLVLDDGIVSLRAATT
jgi:hypothetical protein